jgi:hypothetical protein
MTNSAGDNLPTRISPARERRTVGLLCLFAAAHVLLFSAVFPFFNVVDEQMHFDVIVRYSHADIPRAIEPLCDEAMNFVAVYHTPEYLWPPSKFPGQKIRRPRNRRSITPSQRCGISWGKGSGWTAATSSTGCVS